MAITNNNTERSIENNSADDINVKSVSISDATSSVAGSTLTNINQKTTSSGTSVGTWSSVDNIPSSSIASEVIYGSVSRVVSQGEFKSGTSIGLNAVARAQGNGGAKNLYAAYTQAQHTGSGDVDFMNGVFSEAKSLGSGSGTIDYIRSINTTATQSNANNTVNFLQGLHVDAAITAGTVGSVQVALLDLDKTGGTITGDFCYLMLEDEAPVVGGTARAIDSKSTLPSRFNGTIQVGDSTITETADNAGAIRYVSSSNRSAQEMLMQTGASTYSWVVIKENTW